MKKSMKILLSAFGVILVLAAAVPMLMTWNQYKSLIEQKFTEATGRILHINGDVRIGILPSPYAKLTDIVIDNPPGTLSKNFATVKSIDVGVALFPLLKKDIQVTHITVTEPAVTLETMANGQNNWQFKSQNTATPTATTETSSPSSTALSVDDFTIEKGFVRIVNVAEQSQQTIGPIEGQFNLESLQGPISGRGTLTVMEKVPVRFEAKVDSLPAEENGVIPFALGMNIIGNAATADFKGQYQKADGSARVESAISVPHLDKIMAALSKDGKIDDLPNFLKQKASATGLVEWKDGRATIDNLTINSGGLEASGGLMIDTGNPKTLTVDLARVVLPPELAAHTKPAGGSASKDSVAKTLENGFKSAAALLDTALPKSPMNFVITATQLPLPNQPTLRDVRLAATTGPSGVRLQNLEAKLPGNTAIQLSGDLPAQADGKIGTAKINTKVVSQNIQAALGQTASEATPVNAQTTIVLTRQNLRLQPLQIIQNGQTVQGDVLYDPKASEALTVAVKGSALNLDSFLGTSPTAASTGKAEPAQKSDPLAKLQGLKAKITAELGSVTFKGKTANKVNVNALLSDNGLQLQQANIGDLGGMVIQANGNVKKFSPLGGVDLNAKASTPNLSQTMRALGNEAAQNLGASAFDASVKGSSDDLKLALNGTIDQGKVAINGVAKQLNATPTFAGTVDISHPETATIMRNFANMKPTTNLGTFALKADVAYGTNTLKANDLVVKLGSAGTLQGSVNILPQGDSRSIDATLKADKLALAALTGESDETNSAQAENAAVQNKDWPREPINLEGLRNLNGQANVAIGELLYKKFVIKNFKTNIKFANNTMTIADFSGGLFDAGKFSLNGQLAPGKQGQAHRGDFAITVSDTDAKKLFEALGSKPFSEGKVDLSQKITFAGASQYDIVRSLNGDGSLKVTDGVINGIDLDGLAAKLDRPNSLSDFAAIMDQTRAGGQTKIGTLTAPITIRNGIGRVDNVAIKTEKTAMGLNGAVNLPEKTVDITGQITFVEQRNLPPLTMSLRGPMSSPSKSFDTRSFTQFYAQKVTEKYQKQATDKIQNKLNKLLGVPEATPETTTTPTTTPAPASTTETAPAPAPAATGTETPAVTPPTAPTQPTAPTATQPSAKQKQRDQLEQLGGQMLQNLLGGGQQ